MLALNLRSSKRSTKYLACNKRYIDSNRRTSDRSVGKVQANLHPDDSLLVVLLPHTQSRLGMLVVELMDQRVLHVLGDFEWKKFRRVFYEEYGAHRD